MSPAAAVLVVVGFLALVPLAGAVLYLVAFLPFTLRAIRLLPAARRKTIDGVATIEEAAASCRASGLSGWNLVARAQSLTAKRFQYSRRNPWDSWDRAFERGMGYCIQQTMALKRLLDRLGISSRPVQSLRVSFPAAVVHGISEPPGTSGHMWLRVSIDGEERDVCPGSIKNRPGSAHFTVRAPVHFVKPWAVPLLHVFSAAENVRRDWKNLFAGSAT